MSLTLSQMRLHVRVVRADGVGDPFMCPVCEKACGRVHNLKEAILHLQQHFDEMHMCFCMYHCLDEECDYAAPNSRDVRDHMETLHGADVSTLAACMLEAYDWAFYWEETPYDVPRDTSTDVPTSQDVLRLLDSAIALGDRKSTRRAFNGTLQLWDFPETQRIMLAKLRDLLIRADETTLRGLYYSMKSQMGPGFTAEIAHLAIGYICHKLGVARHFLPVSAKGTGLAFGNFRLRRLHGGEVAFNQDPVTIREDYSVATDVLIEPLYTDDAPMGPTFILWVEDNDTLERLCDTFTVDFPGGVLITGCGCPSFASRRFCKLLTERLDIPVFIAVDFDPYGLYIALTIKYGSVEARRVVTSGDVSVSNSTWIGPRFDDVPQLEDHKDLSEEGMQKLEFVRSRAEAHGELLMVAEADHMKTGHSYQLQDLSKQSMIRFLRKYLPQTVRLATSADAASTSDACSATCTTKLQRRSEESRLDACFEAKLNELLAEHNKTRADLFVYCVAGPARNVTFEQSDVDTVKLIPSTFSHSSSSRALSQARLCLICGANADGLRYGVGVDACSACKKFYRLADTQNKEFRCAGDGNCEIHKDQRKHEKCSACRLDKCIRVGMDKSAVGREADEKDSLAQPRLCLICGAKADGIRYGGVEACSACATFFCSAVLQNKEYRCAGDGNCEIHKDQRKHEKCSACRLDKCIRVGMDKSAVGREAGDKDLLAQPRLCLVCGAKADGIRYGGVEACTACATFFRRTVALNKEFRCAGDGNCEIHKDQRKHEKCSACRLDKCIRVGMDKSAVGREADEKDSLAQPRLCLICGAKADGIRYGVEACSACSRFFCRVVLLNKEYRCAGDGNCEIHKDQLSRNKCSACRLDKCIRVGMDKDWKNPTVVKRPQVAVPSDGATSSSGFSDPNIDHSDDDADAEVHVKAPLRHKRTSAEVAVATSDDTEISNAIPSKRNNINNNNSVMQSWDPRAVLPSAPVGAESSAPGVPTGSPSDGVANENASPNKSPRPKRKCSEKAADNYEQKACRTADDTDDEPVRGGAFSKTDDSDSDEYVPTARRLNVVYISSDDEYDL